MIADHPVGVCSEETVQQLNSTECQSNFKGDLGFIFSTLHTIMYDMCRPDQVHNKYTIYIYYLCTFKIPGGGDDDYGSGDYEYGSGSGSGSGDDDYYYYDHDDEYKGETRGRRQR